ncbi:hypothetical protein NX722_18630 [Endozoicomonas gorgoniicola]|uniref:Uncharacterized protein n=1 Tax=Endozoicomonas gorgoniicola TaxID=1234144 RepID=A0ABT3MYY9_9GAMM|nr:hypothetical protein [Endozoicomonas gorgoniicola]MCW7554597.1 hypothetical protein [Endozoicomonas gorgoniicola]
MHSLRFKENYKLHLTMAFTALKINFFCGVMVIGFPELDIIPTIKSISIYLSFASVILMNISSLSFYLYAKRKKDINIAVALGVEIGAVSLLFIGLPIILEQLIIIDFSTCTVISTIFFSNIYMGIAPLITVYLVDRKKKRNCSKLTGKSTSTGQRKLS